MNAQPLCLITGATSGIGKATAAGLARKGFRVVIVGRDARRTDETVGWLRREAGTRAVEGLVADLSSQQEVRRLAAEFRRRYDRLEVLINNAGNWFGEYGATVDGIERTWALNHLAYVQLTLELLERLRASAPARIVNVASNLHARGFRPGCGPMPERSYRGMAAYSQSKLANVLATYALARRLAGTGVTVNSLHPGAVASGMGRDMTSFLKQAQKVLRWFFLSPERGAETSIHLASAAELEGVSGRYFVRCRESRSCPASEDVALQEQWWEESLRQIGRQDAFAAGPGGGAK